MMAMMPARRHPHQVSAFGPSTVIATREASTLPYPKYATVRPRNGPRCFAGMNSER